MTRIEANREAHRRWGWQGVVFPKRHGVPCRVGKWKGGEQMGPDILGEGKTWKAAFEDADRKAQESQTTKPGGESQ